MVNETDSAADLIVDVNKNSVLIYGNESNESLVESELIDNNCLYIQNIVNALESIVYYRRVVELHNEDVNSQIQGKLQLRLRKYLTDDTLNEIPIIKAENGDEIILPYDAAADHHWYLVEITNKSHLPVFPYLFVLAPDYSLILLYPGSGQGRSIDPRTNSLCWLQLLS